MMDAIVVIAGLAAFGLLCFAVGFSRGLDHRASAASSRLRPRRRFTGGRSPAPVPFVRTDIRLPAAPCPVSE
jgi:hypothetical protein